MGAFDLKKVDRVGYGAPIFFTSSMFFTIPQSGLYRIDAVGPGASGGAVHHSGIGVSVVASGGGGGGYSMKEVWLNAGVVLNIMIGVPGAAQYVQASGGGQKQNGQNGGDVSIVGGGVSMGATGGKGGLATWASTTMQAGGLGGRGFGGDLNFKGGQGGSVSTIFTSSCAMAGGGGSSGSPYGDGRDGEGLLAFSASGGSFSGYGAGVFTNAAGSAIPSIQSPVGPASLELEPARIVNSPLFASPNLPLLYLSGNTSAGTHLWGGPGAGGIGGYQAMRAGALGGSGGWGTANVAGGSGIGAGAACIGGGSGAAAANNSASSTNGVTVLSGQAGRGLVILERIGA